MIEKTKNDSVTADKTLPAGWEWQHWEDGSGSMLAPDGKRYFQYDKNTREYKLSMENPVWEYHPDLGFDEFLKYAEKEARMHSERQRLEKLPFFSYLQEKGQGTELLKQIEKVLYEDNDAVLEQIKENYWKPYQENGGKEKGTDFRAEVEQIISWKRNYDAEQMEGIGEQEFEAPDIMQIRNKRKVL